MTPLRVLEWAGAVAVAGVVGILLALALVSLAKTLTKDGSKPRVHTPDAVAKMLAEPNPFLVHLDPQYNPLPDYKAAWSADWDEYPAREQKNTQGNENK